MRSLRSKSHTPTHAPLCTHTHTHTHPHLHRNLRRMSHKRIYAYIYMYIYIKIQFSTFVRQQPLPPVVLCSDQHHLYYRRTSLHTRTEAETCHSYLTCHNKQNLSSGFRAQNILQLICHLSVSPSFQPQLLHSIHKLRSPSSLLVCHRVVLKKKYIYTSL